jgi:hypothetical protein
MQPLSRGPSGTLKLLIAAFLLLAAAGLVLAILSRGGTPFE